MTQKIRLCENCEQRGPQAGQQDPYAVAHKQVGEPEAREKKEGAQDHQQNHVRSHKPDRRAKVRRGAPGMRDRHRGSGPAHRHDDHQRRQVNGARRRAAPQRDGRAQQQKQRRAVGADQLETGKQIRVEAMHRTHPEGQCDRYGAQAGRYVQNPRRQSFATPAMRKDARRPAPRWGMKPRRSTESPGPPAPHVPGGAGRRQNTRRAPNRRRTRTACTPRSRC